jgi:hypothetical protein
LPHIRSDPESRVHHIWTFHPLKSDRGANAAFHGIVPTKKS